MRRTAIALAIAFSTVIAVANDINAQAIARQLRIAADAEGAALPQEDAPPGEKRYHLAAGTTVLHMAFDCIEDAPNNVQVRVMQPPGTILFQEDHTCTGGGTKVVSYDRDDFPFPDNEYVVNLYVTSPDNYIADSVQFVVGEAGFVESQGETVPTSAASPQPAGTPGLVQNTAPNVTQPAAAVGEPSRWMLVVAGIGILGLIAVVGWAGRSAMRS